MKKYQIFYKFTGDIEVEAKNETEAKRLAEDRAWEDAKYNSELEILDIYED